GLPPLGFRSALHHLRPEVPVGEGQAQHPGRHRGAPVQAAAAQREAEGESGEVRQPDRRRLSTTIKASNQDRLPGNREAVLFSARGPTLRPHAEERVSRQLPAYAASRCMAASSEPACILRRRIAIAKWRPQCSSATVLVVKRAAIFCCLGAWR